MPDNCKNDCPVLPRVEALERANEQHGRTHREIFGRLNSLERFDAVQEEHYKSIDDKLDKLIIWQEAQQAKPAKRWDGLVDKLICAAAGAFIAWLAAGMPGP